MKTYLAIIVSLSILFMTACEEKKKKSNQVKFELNSIPPGAKITLNSKIPLKNITPTSVDIGPGTYLVKMTKKACLPAWKYVTVKANKEARVTLTLAPVRGSVLITSNPLGAKVIMEGKRQGITPLVMTNMKLGEYSAQIEHINRAPRVVKWAITDVRPKKVSAALESDIGKLILKTVPSKARVYIDGRAVGISTFRGELQEGMHKIKVTKTGFAEIKTSVDIARDKEITKTITLIRLPGTFEFRSNPEGALVYINNRVHGKTPLVVADIQAGKYKVRVEKNGFDSMSRDAYITAGRKNIVEFKMLRNTGGIDLIVNPPGVSIYVNGKKHGLTIEGESKTLSKVIHIRNLQAGKYQIMLAHKRMQPPTIKKYIRVKKAKITRPKPINVWIANSVLKVNNEAEIHVLLYEKNKKHIIYSPEPGVKIRKKVSEIEFVRPLTEQDQ